MLQKRLLILGLVLTLLAGLTATAVAKVSPEEAARLGKDLTPFGAERAGNADGTIPAWEGGITEVPAGIKHKKGDFYQDPFADDKALYSITAANVDQYADKLNAGQLELFRKYPDYRIDVYPTRRTAAAPEWIYENSIKNATRATLTEDKQGMTGACGGIPFPIPQNGEEAIYNHLARWKGQSGWADVMAGVVLPNGSFSLAGGGRTYEKYPYYANDPTAETCGNEMWKVYQKMETPARRKGELVLIIDDVNPYSNPRKAWQYLPGQRRVRRAPTISYDTPYTSTAGLCFYDETYLFVGALDRFDWKLVGKKEMYVPYNTYQATLATRDELLTGRYPNPDVMRWELHRVWQVEATLKEGKRHAYAKRTFYLDEDSWSALLSDSYDGKGNLWRTAFTGAINFYEVPMFRSMEMFYMDFQTDTYGVNAVTNGLDKFIEYHDYDAVEDAVFTPENLRRKGRR